MGEDIIFTKTDSNSLVMSKGAVYAGFTVLLNQAGLDFSSSSQFMDEYTSALFLLHTNIDEFQHVKSKLTFVNLSL
jgi:uncharacterized 2Fe-2S/4Fe-4S cluster protein (DUF4445 family)